MIAIVDYDAGNLHSVAKACAAVGMDARPTARAADIDAADGVILPGVGAFPDCMRRLEARALVDPLRGYLRADRPFLGICLGLQLLFDYGEEGEGAAGLGHFPGRVRRIVAPGLKIPHMGWNALHLHASPPAHPDALPDGELRPADPWPRDPSHPALVSAARDQGTEVPPARPGTAAPPPVSSPLFAGIPEGAYVYFVHSYQAIAEDEGVLTASVDYGGRITAAVGRGRVHAVQFHPEKSSLVGLALLRNFAGLCTEGGAR